jgi:hypothetical protein
LKRKIKYFIAASVITAMLLFLFGMIILTEYKTLSLGFEEVDAMFSLQNGKMIINDREYTFYKLNIDQILKYAIATFLIF